MPLSRRPAELYAERVERFRRRADRLGRRSRLVSNLRGLTFAVVVFPIVLVLFAGMATRLTALSVAALVVFLALVFWHARVLREEDAARRWERVNRDALLRCTGRWSELSADGSGFADPDHPYAEDLDVFGPGSLFQRICTAHTHFGQEALAGYLAEATSGPEARRRQEAVRSLAPDLEMRQRLEAHASALIDPAKTKGRNADGAAPDPEPLLRWAEGPPRLSDRALLVWSARVLPVVTLAGILGASFLALPPAAWLVPVLLQVAVVWRTRSETTRVFTAVSSAESAFTRYAPMLEVLEGLEVESALVADLQRRACARGRRPSEAMRAFQRALSWFEVRHNGLVHPFLNVMTLWDVHCVLRLEAWQRTAGSSVRAWFEAVGHLEALASLAALAHDEPHFSWPEIVEGPATFRAEGLGHPLIEGGARVANDVALAGPGRALLVTGSNMSGKSTLLRSIGLALVLALAGGPVCARRLVATTLVLRSSVRARDSLERGVSRFYAELRKIKAVLDAAEAEGAPSVLFLLDEILHGTNSRERRIGARWVLAELLRRGAIGAVSTHDMALCRLDDELMTRVEQVHFRESIEAGKMTFDYVLRPGPVTAGNALRLMRLVGIAVPVQDGG